MNEDPIIIIGAGPAGLMAAQQLALKGYRVHIYEKNKAAARKFLVAGHGGFNLTHNEPIDTFIQKYDALEIKKIVQSFDNEATIQWLSSIGISTYVGSSGKIFPSKNTKPIQVLQAWLDHLQQLGVSIHYGYTWLDFDKQSATFESDGIIVNRNYQKLILALGGGSWKKTGSDAAWIAILKNKNIAITALQSANSGYNMIAPFKNLEGQVLKNISISFGDQRKLGEIVFTKYGIEGSPIYYMNRYTRNHEFPLFLHIDLKPHMSEIDILEQLQSEGNVSSILKNKLKLSSTALTVLKNLDKATFTDPITLAQAIKKFPIQILSLRPIDEVISTAGGVSFAELDERLAFHKFPTIYCAGEMIDWEAPTGGYLLQACFSTGVWVAQAISNSLVIE
ncbi:TIGR03862 family flavoprotein [Sphingobacterium sp. SRCM116780]|uniref:NAD(P)/FAD-dependent oxidoreductase n=1 Tax=Sphingobacterium sp. SRCM116780 TaxID=2907623 RepID=UPI001F26BC58|nr:TIGR03862 family flavoprotein [Sphingobacterium sp. SRCM116780]UIR57963.1 TIGR03862 family flavoprotein [Sphingobacterium sp. SRCM116780]